MVQKIWNSVDFILIIVAIIIFEENCDSSKQITPQVFVKLVTSLLSNPFAELTNLIGREGGFDDFYIWIFYIFSKFYSVKKFFLLKYTCCQFFVSLTL